MQKLANKAVELLNEGKHVELFDWLEGQDDEIMEQTDLVEMTLLMYLRVLKKQHTHNNEFKSAIEPNEEQITRITDRVASAKSLEMGIIHTPNKYNSLVGHISRIVLHRQIMTNNPKFWEWVKDRYPNMYRLLIVKEGLDKENTNSFVQVLSEHFKNNDPYKKHMQYIDSVCKKTWEFCNDKQRCDYAQKLHDNFMTAIAEMKILAIAPEYFQKVEIEPKINPTKKVADLGFEFESTKYMAEVYAHDTIVAACPQSFERIDFRKEWEKLFEKKSQIEALRETNTPTVYVLAVGFDYLNDVETRTERFREYVRKNMPEHSEVVIIRLRGRPETISIRQGEIVPETTLAKKLQEMVDQYWDE